jgi:hypothetical protein
VVPELQPASCARDLELLKELGRDAMRRHSIRTKRVLEKACRLHRVTIRVYGRNPL